VIGSGLPEYKLTIGELFPADDVVAQWVFTLTAVADDLRILLGMMDLSKMEEQIAEQTTLFRLLMSRLLEARRVVDAWRRFPEIQDLTGGKLEFGSLDLLSAYSCPDGKGARSQVEKLYVDSRNRTVHYSHVGESELTDLLRDYGWSPARITVSERHGKAQLEYQWVTAVRIGDSIGSAPWAVNVQKLARNGRQVSSLATAWIMLGMVCLMLYARKQGIPLERIVDDPEKLKDIWRRGKDDESGSSGES
jgi:hypothetical protein